MEAKARHTTPYVLDSVTIFALSFFRTRNSNLIEIIIVESKKKRKDTYHKGVTAKESKISCWLVSPAKRALKNF